MSDWRSPDYSPGSQADFRAFLQQRFGSLARFNAEAGTDFARWDDVVPPDRDIRKAPLRGFWQHFDSYADGRVPVWLARCNRPRGRASTSS